MNDALTTQNETLKNSLFGMVGFSGTTEDNWDKAIDAVNYPVNIVSAFYKDEDSEYVNANGETNTGRGKDFNLVVVDKLRNGNKNVISCVTGQYGTVSTPSLYVDFKEQLEELGIDHDLKNLYVSGNGGRQYLVVKVNNLRNLNMLPDELDMYIMLSTSVDGSKSHTLNMIAHNKTGDTSINLYGGDYRLAARHTTTLAERTVNFIPSINRMIANWNDLIMPTMNLMYDCKYDREFATDLVEEIATDAGMGERHADKIVSLYSTGQIKTNDQNDSLYRVMVAVNQYIDDEMEESPELQQRFKNNVAKKLEAVTKKELNKKSA